jgi:hypothetical protein
MGKQLAKEKEGKQKKKRQKNQSKIIAPANIA